MEHSGEKRAFEGEGESVIGGLILMDGMLYSGFRPELELA